MARRSSRLRHSLILALGLILGIALQRPALAQVFNPETFTLANGLQVVVISNHRSPIVTHMVWYKIGAADEVWGKSGIAHFLEHLMFRGTHNIPPGEFSKIVARNGGRDNAFTSYDYTAYFQNVSRDRLELVMKMEADRMANLVLSDEIVNTERDVILEERRQVIENRPGALLNEQMNAAMFLNSPYHRPIIGWEHEMRALTREDAVNWYNHYYAPNNAILVVAGDVTVADLKPLAEKYYGPVQPRDVPPRVRPQEPLPPRAARRVELKDPRVANAQLTRSYLAPSYRAGETQYAYALQVLAELLGGATTSRLNRALVLEQQVATSAGAWYDASALDLGTFGFSATVRSGTEIRDVEAALDAQIQKILTEGASDDEVERAKSRMRASAIYARDSLSTGARVIGSALTTGQTTADVEAWPERIGAVTAAQVNAAARAILQPERSVTGWLLPKPAS
jgi:zinc protease